jgi:kynurenine formamidase
MTRFLLALLILGRIGASPVSLGASPSEAVPAPARPEADFDKLMTDLSNWGRWGKQDQIGAINLITAEKKKSAYALVRDGLSVSLARNLDKIRAADNGSPFVYTMERAGTNNPGYSCADAFFVSYHGMAHTHIDSLCHMFYKGKLYNGFAQTNITANGAQDLGIQNLKQGIATRGVLVDIPLLKNVPYLEPGTPILPADLDAWEKKANIKVGPGDVLLIRTGRWARRDALGPWSGKYAGLDMSCAPWLKAGDISILGSDCASDVLPSNVQNVTMPIHQLTLIAMGAFILDNCDLEPLAKTAAQKNRWEFLLTVNPLAIPNGTGSPVNPIATF